MTITDITSIFALVVSALAVLISLSAHRLSLRKEKERISNTAINYVRYEVTEINDIETSHFYLIEIFNKSDANTSISEVILEVEYISRGGPVRARFAASDSGNKCPALALPCRLDGRQSVKGWLQFSLPNEFTDRIDDVVNQRIVAIDIFGSEISIRTMQLRNL